MLPILSLLAADPNVAPAFRSALAAQPVAEPNYSTLLLPLGAALVEVCYRGVRILGALVNGELVDVDCFGADVVDQWQAAVRENIEEEAAEMRDVALAEQAA